MFGSLLSVFYVDSKALGHLTVVTLVTNVHVAAVQGII